MDLEQILNAAEASGDPAKAMIARYLRERVATRPPDAENVPVDERRLRDALRRAKRRNTRLAAACGACPCWGERPDCPDCAGRGVPGSHAPDEQAFLTYIAPVLRAIGLIQTTKEGSHDDEE